MPEWQTTPFATIGHNQGPPLDPGRGWRAFCWGKAQKKAWKAPPVEVVRSRAKRAQALGLSYRDYTAIMLDRGTSPRALFFDLGGTLVQVENDEIRADGRGRVTPLPGVVDKLSGLKHCLVFIVTNQAGVAEGRLSAAEARSFVEQVDALCGGIVTDSRICMDPADSGSPFRKPRPGMVLDLLAEHGVPASAAVMIGDSDDDRRCAEAAKLARFIWARDYFGWGTR